MVPLQKAPGLQVFEAQQTSPGSPQGSHVPPQQRNPVSQLEPPPQHKSPSPPHGMQVPDGLHSERPLQVPKVPPQHDSPMIPQSRHTPP